MCAEIEAKLKVDSHSEIERKLGELGAKFLGEQLQTDYFFDDTNTTLIKTDKCLRLRKQKADNNENYFLTYKGSREESNFKKRQEIESEIKDAGSFYKLLSALGYEQVLVLEKKRCLWQYGDCEVALDHLPDLGDFVEIEGPDEQSIVNVQNILGLSGSPHISKSYAYLLMEKLQQSDK
ncbi:MAG: class IV adenylate cyclase [Sedimentisphaerales bacterium]|nr:class IV adenylate cyclase [Sedimentisphaerales bacterium]